MLVVSVGCPAGIGPEVSVEAAAKTEPTHDEGRAGSTDVLLVGDFATLQRAAKVRGIDPKRLVRVEQVPKVARRGKAIHVLQPTPDRVRAGFGTPTPEDGALQLAWIDAALEIVRTTPKSAMVTGPANKSIIVASGEKAFRGHTEYLMQRLGAKEVVMSFSSGPLTTALVTTHLPLRDVADAIRPKSVAAACFWLAEFTARLGISKPIVVAGLNPHAGEGGLLGDEEQTVIARGIERAKKRLREAKIRVDLLGPIPAESAFRKAANGDYAGVVAMYHDQATIPMKLLGFGEAVNVSLGLPIVRTSVDHGTAYDIAGSGNAGSQGMQSAFALARRLIAVR
jgi:4-phospho-D-threonate 3-dehydrogenase / 4-phospho-D-erythronate 3-dehydrogenase